MIDNLNTLLFVIMAIPLLGIIFAGLSKENSNGRGHNVLAVGIFTVLSNLVVLWITARKVDFSGGAQHLSAKFEWLAVPKIELIFELDFFSLLLIAAVHLWADSFFTADGSRNFGTLFIVFGNRKYYDHVYYCFNWFQQS